MNIRELKEKIKDLPDHMDVCIQQDKNTDFAITNVETAKVIKAGYAEEPDGPVLAKDKVFLLTDEL